MAKFVKYFDLEKNDLELSRPVQPNTYFDKVGRRCALLGFERGTFEVWCYPMKILRNCELSFLLQGSVDPIKGSATAKSISVTPEATTITYSYQSFTVREIFVAPIDEEGTIILLDVKTVEPISIIMSFLPVLVPMWPAGMGGQYSVWDNELKGFVISESRGEYGAIVGSPAASAISLPPAHQFADTPNQFKIEVTPDSAAGYYVPIVIAGGSMEKESAKQIYRELCANPEKHYREAVQHYRNLRENTLELKTEYQDLNLAFEWGKLALDNLVADTPQLGTGLIAGLGPSGASGRPGFGWYFSGDAAINGFSLNSYGAYATVRDALSFVQKTQRADGKIAHELSQSEGFIKWFEDYHFGYMHADTTPFFLVAIYDYLRCTGDIEFIRASWDVVLKGYRWCLTTDENGDGLMDNRSAGLGALEFGQLTGIHTDIYLSSIWVKALEAMEKMAKAVGDEMLRTECAMLYSKALRTLNEKFWDEKNRVIAYAENNEGSLISELGPWSTVGMAWNLIDEDKSQTMLEKINSSRLSTDWGCRVLSTESKLYHSLNYNYGAVWPFITGFVAAAQYQHHHALEAHNMLMANVKHTFDNALGQCAEVFCGEFNRMLEESVPHQGFSTTGVMMPTVRGLLGLSGNALEKAIVFSPHLPANWSNLEAKRFVVGDNKFFFVLRKQDGLLELSYSQIGKDGYIMNFSPAFAFGTQVKSVLIDGRESTFKVTPSDQDVHVFAAFKMGASGKAKIYYAPSLEILPAENMSSTGDSNKGLRIISMRGENNRLRLTVEGLANRTYRLRTQNSERVASIANAEMERNEILIKFGGNEKNIYKEKVIDIVLR
jgi:glycogen debranching enzyme